MVVILNTCVADRAVERTGRPQNPASATVAENRQDISSWRRLLPIVILGDSLGDEHLVAEESIDWFYILVCLLDFIVCSISYSDGSLIIDRIVAESWYDTRVDNRCHEQTSQDVSNTGRVNDGKDDTACGSQQTKVWINNSPP